MLGKSSDREQTELFKKTAGQPTQSTTPTDYQYSAMIQRPQSVLLLIVIGTLLVVGFMGVVHVQAVDTAGITPEYTLLLLTSVPSLLAAGIAVCALLRYDNRELQYRLGSLNFWFIALLIGLTMYLPTYTIASPLCIVAFLSNGLANRYIKKDDRLVRAADRIR